ncbi:MAG: hypothetical protein IKW74_04760, partial [Thermoguttaceae bacterium]|nr:hypothetical protein [Thermoguttaceae bacterium]
MSGLLFLGALGAMGQVPALYADEEFFREAQELRENRIADLEVRINQLTPTFYVAKNGNDQWSGTLADPNPEKTDGPFATLEKARDAVRLLRNNAKASDKSYTVVVREGVYELNSPVTLTREDSGTPDAPVIWTAAPGEDVLISAGKRLNGAHKVTDEAVLNRLKPEVRDQVVVIDLKENGVTEYGSPDGNGAEIFWDRKSMSFSRYPNEGFINIVDLVREGTHEADIRGTKGIQEGIFYFDDDELLTWDQEKDIWVNGYWFWDWANQRQQV